MRTTTAYRKCGRDHPSNYDRELNAKQTYVRSEFDDAPRGYCLTTPKNCASCVTYKFYRYYFKIDKDVILADPVEVQGFIDEEHGDRTYDSMYQGLYDNRNLLLKGIQDMAQDIAKEPWSIKELGYNHANLYTAEVKHRSQLYYKRLEEKNLMIGVFEGWIKPKDDELKFRGDTYEPGEAKRLLKKVEKEIDNDNRWLAELDRKVFLTYFQMALHINQAVAEELYRRYEFHLELQNIWYELSKQNGPIDAAIDYINSRSGQPIPGDTFEACWSSFGPAQDDAWDAEDRQGHDAPRLEKPPRRPTASALFINDDLIDGLSKYEQKLSIDWINGLLYQFRQMKSKVDRTHFKSLKGILALQERIGANARGAGRSCRR